MKKKTKILLGCIAAAVVAVFIVCVMITPNGGTETYGSMVGFVKLSEKDYIGIEIPTAKKKEIQDKQVEAQINAELNGNAVEKKAKHKDARKGDIATISFEGSIKGKKFDGGSSEEQDVELGSGTMIPGFEEGIIGMEIGNTKIVKVTFPKDYHNNKELEGKEADFKIKLKGLKKKIVPTIEEYVKENTSYDSVSEYKKAVRKNLEKQMREMDEQSSKTELLNSIIKKAKFVKYPEDRLKAQREVVKRQLESYATQSGKTLEDNYELFGFKDEKDFNKYVDKQTKKSLQQGMVISYIAQMQKIKIPEKDRKAADEQMKGANIDEKTFEAQYGMTLEEYVETTLLQEAVLDFIMEKAKK